MSYADRVERIQPSLTLKINAEAAAIQADHRGDEAVVPLPCWVTYPAQVTLTEALLHKAGVAVVPGSGFGAPGRLRVVRRRHEHHRNRLTQAARVFAIARRQYEQSNGRRLYC